MESTGIMQGLNQGLRKRMELEKAKFALSEKVEGIKCKNGCDPMKLFEIGNSQFECKECNEVFVLSELNEGVKE